MAIFEIEGSDGSIYEVDAPDETAAVKAFQGFAGQQSASNEVGESWRPGQDEPAPAAAPVPFTPKGELTERPVTIGDRLYDAANALGLPASRMRRDNQSLDAAVRGAADVMSFGLSDEISAGLGAATGVGGQLGEYDKNLELQRAIDKEDANGNARLIGQLLGGGVMGMAIGPGLWANAPSVAGRAVGGAATGAGLGGAYGIGSGEGGALNRAYEAGKGAVLGGVVGGALPAIGAGAGRVYEAGRNWRNAGPIARQAGADPETLRMLGQVLDADGSLTAAGQANMARAGQEAMLADAGPMARSVLDTAIQRSGTGARVVRERLGDRVGRDTQALAAALDNTLGAPQGVTASRTAIRQGTSGARQAAYDDAYAQAIDYSEPRAMQIEELLRARVPQSALNRANELMRAEGAQSRQIMARVADDGSISFEQMPDVRQIDYITRALNDLADAGEGAGALGGQNALGRAYQNLSRDIRGNLRELVPEYGQALDVASDAISRSRAVETGSRLLSPSMTRDQAAEAIQGMTQAERAAAAQGVRSQIDDAMARVTRTVADGDVDAREAVKALKDLSSRANREKLALVMGDEQSGRLFNEVDRVAQSFDLRSSVAENSKTYARQAMDQRIKSMTAPSAIEKVAQGEPLNAAKRIAQAITGQTPERMLARQDEIYGQLADLLTRQGGAGQGTYDAITRLGQTDAATQLMAGRIAAALSPRLAYPLGVQGQEMLR